MIELVFVTAIIALLASIALPKYAEVLLRSQEGSLRGNLGALRSAISIYYTDNDGNNPRCGTADEPTSTVLTDTMIPKYLNKMPQVKSGRHPPTSNVYCDDILTAGQEHDASGWYYDGKIPPDSHHGMVWVACVHTDSKGSIWTSY